MIKESISKDDFEELKVVKINADDRRVNSEAYFWEP